MVIKVGRLKSFFLKTVIHEFMFQRKCILIEVHEISSPRIYMHSQYITKLNKPKKMHGHVFNSRVVIVFMQVKDFREFIQSQEYHRSFQLYGLGHGTRW